MDLSEKHKEHPQIRAIVIFIILMTSIALVVNFIVAADNNDRNTLNQVVPHKEDVLPPSFNFNNLHNAEGPEQFDKIFLHNYPAMKDIAHEITSFFCTDEKNDYCKVRGIITYIKANIRLIYWETNVYYENPITTLLREEGDHDALNILFVNLAKASGIETKFVLVNRKSFALVKVNNPPKDVKLENGWMRVDASCKTCLIGSIDFEHRRDRKIFPLTD